MTENDTVIDLGCSVGAVSRAFADKVKNVIGIDCNQEFIHFCNARKKGNECFITCDFESVDYSVFGGIDGIWASFSLSYLSHPQGLLNRLYSEMKEGAWIALVDISCFISGNLPESSKYYQKVRQFELASCKSGIYDFDFGDKMPKLLEKSGFNITYRNDNVSDPELNFSGAAKDEVIQVWHSRLARMKKLEQELGAEYSSFCRELISNLSQGSHEKRDNVRFVIATKPAADNQ